MTATTLMVAGGVGLGMMAALSTSRRLNALVMIVTLIGLCISIFWLSTLLLLVFGVWLHWVPIMTSSGFQTLVLPSICLAIPGMAMLARLTRASVLEAARQDYVQTARAKGLAGLVVALRHILRNAYSDRDRDRSVVRLAAGWRDFCRECVCAARVWALRDHRDNDP